MLYHALLKFHFPLRHPLSSTKAEIQLRGDKAFRALFGPHDVRQPILPSASHVVGAMVSLRLDPLKTKEVSETAKLGYRD
jgi:hypothetical protein